MIAPFIVSNTLPIKKLSSVSGRSVLTNAYMWSSVERYLFWTIDKWFWQCILIHVVGLFLLSTIILKIFLLTSSTGRSYSDLIYYGWSQYQWPRNKQNIMSWCESKIYENIPLRIRRLNFDGKQISLDHLKVVGNMLLTLYS